MASIMSSRLAAELDHAFERNGWSTKEVKQLSSGKLLAKMRKVVLGQAEIKAVQHIIDCDADPFVPDDWKVEEHKKCGQFKWSASLVQLFLAEGQQNDNDLNGHNLRAELEDKPVLNANVLDYLLAHPELIPEDWKVGAIFFWGTIYRVPRGRLCVRCLCWGDGGWRWSSSWLDSGWVDTILLRRA